MNLRITHHTEYRYASAVNSNSNELRLTPVESLWQHVSFSLLRVVPSTRLRRYQDFYGNTVNHFEIEEPHRRLLIEATSAVKTHDRYAAGEPFGVPLESLSAPEERERLQPFLQSGGVVQITPEIWRAAVDERAACSDVFGLAKALMGYVFRTCRYMAGATDVNTSTEHFFHSREGVCQDFSHLMLALCRSVQLPARYVSGYVYDAKRKDLRGAHASHAWVEVWVPGHGWHGLDPTNDCLTQDHYVVVAIGREYEDIAPVRGSFWGAGDREMFVSVHLEERM
jgi:transglutaminase-like putative cysteine protease